MPDSWSVTSPHNAKVGFLRTLHTPKGRAAAQAVLVEGPHLLAELRRAHLRPDFVLYDPEAVGNVALTPHFAELIAEGVEVLTAPASIIARVATTQTPQGVVAVVPLAALTPERLRAQRRGRARPLLLILDDLQDPGNVGTILRSALAADVDEVLLTPDCADVYAPKVVRAASGAHFHLPVRAERDWETIAKDLAGAPKVRQVVLADAAAGEDYTALDFTQRTAMIISNEARGPSEAARRLATRPVRIAMYNGVESLNAAIAASIMLFESVRQRRST